MTTYEVNGDAIDSIASFYAELNRIFMADEDWRLGESLDAFNDLLYGGFGAMPSDGTVTLVWHNLEATREALGAEATRAWLQAKLDDPAKRFNQESIQRDLDALNAGEGATYFDIILQIIANHPRVCLIKR